MATGQEIPLDERTHRHVVQVLRLRAGAPLILFNGQGGEYTATLVQAERRASRVRVEAHAPRDTQPPLPITLVQGISKGDHMDFALQKATELGVSRIQPVISQRTVGGDNEQRLAKKMTHWLGIIISASEQCGRNEIPHLLPPQPLEGWLSEYGATPDNPDLGLVLDPMAPSNLTDITVKPASVTLLIGPEGGLEEREIGQAIHVGMRQARLGPRILRTETAGMATLAVLQALWGDLGSCRHTIKEP